MQLKPHFIWQDHKNSISSHVFELLISTAASNPVLFSCLEQITAHSYNLFPLLFQEMNQLALSVLSSK